MELTSIEDESDALARVEENDGVRTPAVVAEELNGGSVMGIIGKVE